MKVRWLVVAAITVSLAIPVGASAHPLEMNAGAFSGQLPELSLFEAEAGRDFFRGSPPSEYDKTDNMRFVGFSARPAAGNLSEANSDIAFQGDRVYQGTFPGFRIIDISNASKPKELINYTDCRHPSGQGDVVIYGDIMTRSWDSASANGMPAGGWPCGDSRVQAGQEGLHVFDVGDPEEPGRRRVHRPPVRLAHRDRRAGSGQRPPDRLQHPVQRLLQRHRRHRDPGRRPVGGHVPPLRGGGQRDRLPRHRRHPRRRPQGGLCRRPGLRGLEHGGGGRRHADRPGAALHEEHQDQREHQHQHRPLGGVLQRRQDADLRPRAERRHVQPAARRRARCSATSPTRCRRTT